MIECLRRVRPSVLIARTLVRLTDSSGSIVAKPFIIMSKVRNHLNKKSACHSALTVAFRALAFRFCLRFSSNVSHARAWRSATVLGDCCSGFCSNRAISSDDWDYYHAALRGWVSEEEIEDIDYAEILKEMKTFEALNDIYIYMCVCACVCVCVFPFRQ